jgi:hypothetical protein
MASVLIEFGRVGWGYMNGLIRSLSMGLVRVSWCRGFFGDALKEAADKLRGRG